MGERIEAPLIALATYRRPDWLAQTLASLWTAVGPELPDRLVVVDNDAAGSARAVVEAAGLGSCYVLEPSPGIVPARNRALDAWTARHDAIIFLDDDEVVDPGWFTALLDHTEETTADIIQGTVISDLSAAPRWVTRGNYMQRKILRHHESLPTAATNTTLLRRASWLRAGAPRFDPTFSATGGSDTRFFTTLHRAGLRIEYDAQARVTEFTPPERYTVKWLARRYYRSGIVLGRIRADHGPVTAGMIARCAGGSAAHAAAWAATAATGRRAQGHHARRALFYAGELGAWAGHRVHEYKRPLASGESAPA